MSAKLALLTILCFLGGWRAAADEAVHTDEAASKEPGQSKQVACKFSKANWSPGFSAVQTLRPGAVLAPQSSLNVDDTVQMSVTLDCSLKDVAYASATFVTSSGAGSAVLLQPDSGKAGMLKGRIAAADLASKGSTFQVAFNAGDPRMQRPVTWSVGELQVKQRNGVDLVVPPLSKREQQYIVPPEITHLDRPEQPQPPAVVPAAATAAVVGVLAVWLMLMSRLRLNLHGVPSGSGAAAAAAFQLLLAATLGFAVLYWLRWSLIDALAPVALLTVLMVLAGHRALSRLAERRIASEAKGSKSD